MNKDMNLNINMETIRAAAPVVLKSLPSLIGIVLVGVFAYTAFELNSLINVQPAATQTALAPLPSIVFSQKVLSSLHDRTDVNGSVTLNLGSNNNPF